MKFNEKDYINMPLGTKITLTNDKILIKYKNVNNEWHDSYNCWTDGEENYCNAELENLNDIKLNIIKVEEPNYSSIYQNILTDKEKEYLHNIIKPFIENVKCIIKRNCFDDYFIQITLYSGEEINLPYFKLKQNKLYKGMELEIKYTVKELGLDY